MIGRREFIAGLGSAAAWPVVAKAQQPQRMRRIGVLFHLNESDPEGRLRVVAFRKGLEQLGWIEGRNIQIDYRWTSGDSERAHIYAAELLALKPEVIFAAPTFVVTALHEKTRSVPIVFAQTGDPIGLGFVASWARPGGNITGFGNIETTIGAKWVELLKQVAPSVTRVAVIYDVANPDSLVHLPTIEAAARSHDVQVYLLPCAMRAKSSASSMPSRASHVAVSSRFQGRSW
jgi:putative ABC transport system substrate-binding protein